MNKIYNYMFFDGEKAVCYCELININIYLLAEKCVFVHDFNNILYKYNDFID